MLTNEKNLSLWQLTSEHEKLLSELYDKETGEVNEIVQARLDQLEPTIEHKCIAVSKWIKHLEAEELKIDDILEALANRQKSYRKEIEKFEKYLQSNMERSGVKEVSCPYFTVRLRRNPYSTDIINENEIPQQFIKVKEIIKIDAKPDKNLIKEEVLRTGIQVPGAYVSQKNKLEILIDKI